MWLKIGIDAEIYDILVHIVNDGTIPCGMLIGMDFFSRVELRRIEKVS